MVAIIGNSSPWRIKKGALLDNVESILKEIIWLMVHKKINTN